MNSIEYNPDTSASCKICLQLYSVAFYYISTSFPGWGGGSRRSVLELRAGHSLSYSRFAIRSPLNFFPWIAKAQSVNRSFSDFPVLLVAQSIRSSLNQWHAERYNAESLIKNISFHEWGTAICITYELSNRMCSCVLCFPSLF